MGDKPNNTLQCDFEYVVTGHCLSKNASKINSMSWEVCNSKCLAAGNYKYFAVQSGGSGCFCGNTCGRWGQDTSKGACSQKCVGNHSEICGGRSRNLVFHIAQPMALAIV